MSNPITSGSVDQPVNDTSSAETKPPASTGTDVADSGNGNVSKVDGNGAAGESTPVDDGTDDGGSNAGRGKRSWKDDMANLRAERRELRNQVQTLQASLEQIRQMQAGIKSPDQAKAPVDFFSDPQAVLRSELASLKEDLRKELQATREEDRTMMQVAQEKKEAIEFARSQKGWTKDDEAELVEIIEEEDLGTLPPMRAVRYAMALLNERRGISNRSEAKARASLPSGGQAPGATRKRVYTEAEMDAWVRDLSINPNKLTPEIEAELRSAYTEGRVR